MFAFPLSEIVHRNRDSVNQNFEKILSSLEMSTIWGFFDNFLIFAINNDNNYFRN